MMDANTELGSNSQIRKIKQKKSRKMNGSGPSVFISKWCLKNVVFDTSENSLS